MDKKLKNIWDRQYTYKEKRNIWNRLMYVSENLAFHIWEHNQDDPDTMAYAEKIKDELHALGVEYDFHCKFPRENED